MKPDVNWNTIKTVLLDMDGTLLDLYFDNYFWQQYLPEKWGKLNNMSPEAAQTKLNEWYKKESGSLSWYCLDFWTEYLKFDVFKLKAEIEHLIQTRPYVEDFLLMISDMPCSLVMVTNAHERLITMKMNKTGINKFFDRIISAHSLGNAKEDPEFWSKLIQTEPFEPETTLLIDDSLPVLRAAKQFGIKHLLAITKPDSRLERQDTAEFQPVDSFRDIFPSELFATP